MNAKSPSLPHDSAFTHVRGQSEFIDDRARHRNELIVGLFYSEKAHAKIKNIDWREALLTPGVEAIYSAKDFPHNIWGTIFQDQPLLADEEVKFVGEVILIIVARSQAVIDLAKKKIKIEFTELEPTLSIRDAISKQSFIAGEKKIERGKVEATLESAPHTLRGTIVIQGAEHFYLESQAAIAYPNDNGTIEVHSSAQHPTEVQHVVAHGLGLQSKDVIAIVKRMGGAFGGKESQAAPIAAYAALVAKKLKKPARLILNKDDDMIITGKRNPFEIDYQVGFDQNGMILALDARLYSDGGAYADLSTSIMERAMLHSDNAYFIPNMRIRGQVCKTNYHPHTAFRGFGGPKGVLMIEKVIEEIAHTLMIDALEVRRKNCYRPGFDHTHYGQKVENNCLPELFETCEKKSDYQKRRKEIDTFNQKAIANDDEFLRGLSMTAVKFGISFTTRFLNQGNAMVNIYRDGSIQVSTGATEMGQGVYARIAQLVSDELGVDPKHIQIMPTSTEKNANTSPTAASSGTDINGAAAVLACQQIKARLSELFIKLQEKHPRRWASQTAGHGTETEIDVRKVHDAQSMLNVSRFNDIEFKNNEVFKVGHPLVKLSFAELCAEAYLNRISLCEYAHYKIPNLSFNKLTGQVVPNEGGAFLYFTQGVAATEVSINRMTGEVKVLRSDVLMDLGRPVNLDLDLGQISGAFIQGLGWMTTENLFYSPGGKLLSHSPSTYKIPSIHDIPRDFRIELIENKNNLVNVRGTKAVGEPPLLLSISVWTAIVNAIAYETKNHPGSPFPQIRVPATAERVLEAMCPGSIKQKLQDLLS